MKCPLCGSNQLWIFVRFSGYVLCEANKRDDVEVRETTSMNSEWDDESPCRCSACYWTGSVESVRESDAPSSGGGVRTRSPVSSLAEVKRRLKDQPCPVAWSDCLHYLLGRIEASESRVDPPQESQKSPKNPRRKPAAPDSEDTTIM